jgi:glycosyltransferase involved in cell wall biosynthesis
MRESLLHLALVGRLDDNSLVVQRTLTPVIEYAMREVSDVMRNISWRGLKLYRPDFSKLNLSDFDLRDCDLRSANFRNADLSKARCNAAQFSGAMFDNAILCDADLEYADFANASLRDADLQRANLYDVKIMHVDLENAKLQGAKFLNSTMDWRLSKNWRSAEFDTKLKESLLKKYEPDTTKPRVLMLLWEFLPVVSGGAWTAAYHLLKNLRMQGADLIVMVPWPPSAVSYYEFGHELELIPVGIEQSNEEQEAIEDAYSVYASSTRLPSTSQLYDSEIKDSPSIFEMVNEFTTRVCKVVEERQLKFDVIHAHDWVTFVAAESLSKTWRKPWVAHFHSTEADRQNVRLSSSVIKVEQKACQEAFHILVPSSFTKQRLINIYAVAEDKVSIAYNCLSDEEDDDKVTSGEFSSCRVVFIGRITWQKGPDIFVDIAREVIQVQPNVEFVIFGKGDMENELEQNQYSSEVYTPPPEFIKGIQDDKSKALHQFIEFEEVVPINYIAETDSILNVKRGLPLNLTRKKHTSNQREMNFDQQIKRP